MKFLFLVLFSFPSMAETWVARGHGAEFELSASTEKVSYRGKVVNHEVEIKPCNKLMLNSFLYNLRKQLSVPLSFTRDDGISLAIDGERSLNVKINSDLGIDFLTMDDQFQRLHISQELLCSK